MKKRRALATQPDGLAHRIASVRRGLGLSQGAFAEAMGVSRNTVVTYEHGQTPCTAVLDRIARAEEARGLGRPVRLRVLKVNPRARAFYERLGFRRTGETDTHDLMEWGA